MLYRKTSVNLQLFCRLHILECAVMNTIVYMYISFTIILSPVRGSLPYLHRHSNSSIIHMAAGVVLPTEVRLPWDRLFYMTLVILRGNAEKNFPGVTLNSTKK